MREPVNTTPIVGAVASFVLPMAERAGHSSEQPASASHSTDNRTAPRRLPKYLSADQRVARCSTPYCSAPQTSVFFDRPTAEARGVSYCQELPRVWLLTLRAPASSSRGTVTTSMHRGAGSTNRWTTGRRGRLCHHHP